MRLIDADALINDILTDYGCDPKYIADETIDGLKPYTDQLILERIGLQPTIAASPWHRVEDELPSMDGYDLVLGVVTGEAGFLRFHKAIMTVSFDPEYKEWFIDEYPDAKITVSHWMLLPEPPKEDMDGERREG